MFAGTAHDRYHSLGFAVSEPLFDEPLLATIRRSIEALHARALCGEANVAAGCVFEKDLPMF